MPEVLKVFMVRMLDAADEPANVRAFAAAQKCAVPFEGCRCGPCRYVGAEKPCGVTGAARPAGTERGPKSTYVTDKSTGTGKSTGAAGCS